MLDADDVAAADYFRRYATPLLMVLRRAAMHC